VPPHGDKCAEVLVFAVRWVAQSFPPLRGSRSPIAWGSVNLQKTAQARAPVLL